MYVNVCVFDNLLMLLSVTSNVFGEFNSEYFKVNCVCLTKFLSFYRPFRYLRSPLFERVR